MADWSGLLLDSSVVVRRAKSATPDTCRSLGFHHPAFDAAYTDFRPPAEVRVEIEVVGVDPEDGNPVEFRS